MVRLSTLAALSLAVVLGAFTFSTGLTPVLPATPVDYAGIALPGYLNMAAIRAEDSTPAANAVTNDGATLGRVLFYDTRLSFNETLSCASCHKQANAFSDPARLSAGFDGGATGRHSMGLSFSRYYRNGRFFWDERAETLEDQVLMPIQDHVEMGMTLDAVVQRLQDAPFYAGLFERAFGSPEVSPERISRALSQFVRTITPTNSRYDVARQAQGGGPGRTVPGLTAQENQGLQLFFGRGNCNACHTTDLFVMTQARNNGLDATITDVGAGNGRFKVGSLRNVGLTAPYMHDGRFQTLEQVVQFYDNGVQNNPGLDQNMRAGGGVRRLGLSAADRAALVAFLRSLTDETLATDTRWSNPFAGGATASEATPAGGLALAFAGPNPARGETAFRVHASGDIRLDVFDAAGRSVATLLDGTVAGETTVRFPTTGLAAGIYVARLSAGRAVQTQTVTVIR